MNRPLSSGMGRPGILVGEPVDVSDAVFSLVNDADPTKKALFSLSGISTGTTRTFTLPNTSSELAILAGTQTFSGNKTFSGTRLTASG
jgi:methyl coenzyme M reductase beta subunit